MTDRTTSLVFGPIPSRRLGRSLGINNVPPKLCSYSCAYCQVGPTLERAVGPRPLYPPDEVAAVVTDRVERARAQGEQIDHLTFVPDGEPTLDAHLGEVLCRLRPLGIPTAVISNGSLWSRDDVRRALAQADWVSAKVDAANDATWRRVNRPHPALRLATVLEGIARFARDFAGTLVSETMLVAGLNDDDSSLGSVGSFLEGAGIGRAYLAIPTRPTPSAAVTAPDEATVLRAFTVLSGFVPRVELLVGYEGDAFASSGDARRDLLDITAVHPLRWSAVQELLRQAGTGWEVVDALVAERLLTEVDYRGERFYVRRFHR